VKETNKTTEKGTGQIGADHRKEGTRRFRGKSRNDPTAAQRKGKRERKKKRELRPRLDRRRKVEKTEKKSAGSRSGSTEKGKKNHSQAKEGPTYNLRTPISAVQKTTSEGNSTRERASYQKIKRGGKNNDHQTKIRNGNAVLLAEIAQERTKKERMQKKKEEKWGT